MEFKRKMQYNGFIDYIQHEKRYSPHTVIAYTSDLEQFYAYMQATYRLTNPADFKHTLIRSWVVSMMDAGVNPRAVNRKLTTLKTYYKFLLRKGIVSESPMSRIQSPKTAKRLPVFVEQEKMQKLIEGVVFEEGFRGIRDKAIIELFYATGMRLSELIGLTDSSIDFGQGTIKVLGKRNKERIIPMNHTISDVLKYYLDQKQQNGFRASTLFFTDQEKKLYPKWVYNLIVKHLGQVSTADKKSPHVLRHTFATHMLNNGADINAIKELLGHASLAATQVYTHNTIEKLKEVYRKSHPRK